MTRIITDEQKQLLSIVEDLKKHQGRKLVLEFIEASVKERENILCGRGDKAIEGLDIVQFSKNTVLREELKILEAIKNYPDVIQKGIGIYQ